MRTDDRGLPGAAHPPYQPPRVTRFGTLRELTRQGFSGVADGGLILAADGSTAPAADPARGSR